MSYLLGIAVAAAVAKKRRSRYSHSSKRKGRSSSSSSSHYHSSSGVSYVQYVLVEMFHNESLCSFFELIEKEYKDEMHRKYIEIRKEIDVLETKKREMTPNFDMLKKSLAKKGSSIYYSIDVSGRNSVISIALGDRLTLNVDNDNSNGLISRVNNIISNNEMKIADYERKIEEKKSMLESEKRRITLFKKYEKEERIRELECDVSSLELEYQALVDNNETYKKFANMDENEKALLDKGLSELRECISVYKEIQELQSKSRKLNTDYRYCLDHKVLGEVVEKLISENKISQTTLEKIFLMLDKVEIKARRGEYNNESCGSLYNKRNIVEWFITNVYEVDESFVDRNYYLPEEDEEEQEEQQEQQEEKPMTRKLVQDNQ